MGFVDFILNLAGLLLWIKWRSLPYDPILKRTPATLVGTLRRAAPSHFRRWHLLAGIGILLVSRAVIYWWAGPAFGQVWVGKLDLAVTVLPFRSDWLTRSLLFSVFSFGLVLLVYHIWLLLLSLLNGKSAAAEPVHRLVRMQLGVIDRWPGWGKILLPFAASSLGWWLASWPLVWLAIIPKPVSAMHRLGESVVIGLGSYLAWKLVAATLLVLHVVNTYVYFGRHPLWNYVNATAQTLLKPLRKVPLRAGRVDFAPVVGIALIFLAAQLAERGLVWVYGRLTV